MAEKTFDGIKLAFGIQLSRTLDLAQPMYIDVSRLGYGDEGIRLTFAINSPYEFNSEVKLSRADAEWLVRRLQVELAEPKNANLPRGSD